MNEGPGSASADTPTALAQRSPPSSVHSQIPLRTSRSRLQPSTTVLTLNNDDDIDDEGTDDAHGIATLNKSDNGQGRNGEEEEEEGAEEELSDDDGPLQQGRIDVGKAWDESDDDEEGEPAEPEDGVERRRRLKRRQRRGPIDHSYISSLRPSPNRFRRWWHRLVKTPSAQASLSVPHVAANLFSASLNPACLLSMPAYFARTGVPLGTAGLIAVAALAGAGGGLWVVLGRYVGGNNIEAITGAGCGRNTKWKANIGRAFSGVLLAVYATGTAVIAYFALADLLLQVLFHYSPRGIPLHDRLFVTLIVGGLLTTPLIIFPLAKRTLIRLSTNLATLLYPIILSMLLFYVYYESPQSDTPAPPPKSPSLNPMHPPSIWAPFSLLPLFSLSASPLQIIAHNRSLRRTGISGSNVKAFMLAQSAQTLAAVGLGVGFGVGVGTRGMGERLGVEIHSNLFTSLPLSDSLNFARVLFILILSSHLALCLVTARSSWARLLKLFNLNPLRKRKRGEAIANNDEDIEEQTSALQMGDEEAVHPVSNSSDNGSLQSGSQSQSQNAKRKKKRGPRRWTKPARDALAGLLLWLLTSTTAYLSGVGGFHRRRGDKEAARPDDLAVEARFTRGQEVIGLIGAGAGFVLPALVWIILFHVRQPRAILPPFATEMGKTASEWFLGPQSVLARQRRKLFANRNGGGGGSAATRRSNGAATAADEEQQPLLDQADAEEDNDVDGQGRATEESQRAYRQALLNRATLSPGGKAPTGYKAMPSDANEGSSQPSEGDRQQQQQHSHEGDAATRILLARKEAQLQKRTRGRRMYQDVIVLAGILPLGVALIVLGAIDLRHGGW